MVENRLDFTNIADYAYAEYELLCDGVAVDKGEFAIPSLAPHATKEVKVPCKLPKKAGEYYLTISYYLKKDWSLVKQGHKLGFDQILLREGEPKPIEAERLP